MVTSRCIIDERRFVERFYDSLNVQITFKIILKNRVLPHIYTMY